MEKIKENKKNIMDNKNINKIPYKNNKRNYGIDLSRIISMLLIINHHIIYHGGPLNKYGKTSFYYKLIIFFNLICCSGVNIFGIISGAIGFYSHKYSNLIYLLLITFFYNIVIALIFKIVSPNLVKDINYFLYPLFITDYWYFNAYFIMYFFLPLINKGIIEMNKKSMMFFIINLFLIISILDVIRNFNKRLLFVDIFLLRGGFSYFWLIILYLFGGYIGRFKIDIYKNRNFFFYIKYLILIIFSGFIRTKIIIYRIQKKNFPIIVDYTAPSEVIISFSIVMILSNINVKNKYLVKFISFFSPLTYGIYLIHNHLLIRQYIIKNYFLWMLKYNFYILILISLLCSLLIFIFCSLIDYIRALIFKIMKII